MRAAPNPKINQSPLFELIFISPTDLLIQMKAPETRRGKKKNEKEKKINLCSHNANTYGFENIPFVSDEKSYSLPDLLV